MARTPSRSAQPARPRNGFRIAALVLLTLAAAVSTWLTYKSWGGGGVPGCDGGDCAAVLSSKWSKVFGVPVGLFGTASYLLLAIMGPQAMARSQRGPQIVAAALSLIIPAAALWFGALQLFVLKAFCPWCTLTHGLAVAGVICMGLSWRCEVDGPRAPARKGAKQRHPVPRIWGAASACTFLLLAGMVIAQVLGPEPPKAQIVTASMAPPPSATASPSVPPVVSLPKPAGSNSAATAASPGAIGSETNLAATSAVSAAPPTAVASQGPRKLSLHGGKFHLDSGTLPVLGRPDAAHLMVMISDYTCRYCRAAHRILHEVRDAFDPAQLGIVMLPTYSGTDSEEIQRMMLAAWKLEPAVWLAVADDLYEERMPINSASVKAALEQRLGALPLETSTAVNGAWINQVLSLSKDIYLANRAIAKRGSIPQFIIGQEVVVGAPADAAEFYDLFARHFGLVREKLPELVLSSGTFDLGRVFAGTPRSLKVAYSNSGRAPLQISRATLPQGVPVQRGVIAPVAPGQISSLEVAFPVPSREGPFEETVNLISNARTSTVPIVVTGTAWKPLTIMPEVLDFGRLDGRSSTQGVMRIEFKEPAHVDSLRSQNPGFVADLREVEPGRTYDIVVQTTPRLGPGIQQGAIMVALRKPVPEGWPESLAVAARATVERAVTVVPPRLMLPKGPLATDRHQQVLVRCMDGSADFQVSSAVLEGGPAFALPEIRRGAGTNDYVVLVSLPAGWAVPPGARLVLETTHPSYRSINVPLVAQER